MKSYITLKVITIRMACSRFLVSPLALDFFHVIQSILVNKPLIQKCLGIDLTSRVLIENFSIQD